MTSRERMLCAVRGGRPDRVPVAPWGFGRIPPESDLGRELVERCDMWIEVGGAGFAFHGANLATETTKETLADGSTLTTTVYHTPAGELRSRHKRTAATSATVEFPCKCAADVEALLSVPYEPLVPDFAWFHETKAKYGGEALVCMGVSDAVCWPATVLAPADFCLLWADAPELFEEMCRVAAQRLDAYVEAACKAGVDAFRIIGGEYVTVQLGPRAVPRLLAPFDTRQVAIMHHYGAIAHYHNHGPIMRFLDALAGLGIDSLDPLEAPPCGDCALAEARRILHGRTCMVGNLDDMEVLDRLPERAVLELAAARLEDAGPEGFMLGGTSSGTYGERAARNFLALARMVTRA